MYHYIYKHCCVSFVVLTLPTISIICGYVLCKVILSYYKHIILLLKLLLDSPKMVMHGKKQNTLYQCKSDAVEASSDINDNSIPVLYSLYQRKLFFCFSIVTPNKGETKRNGKSKDIFEPNETAAYHHNTKRYKILICVGAIYACSF